MTADGLTSDEQRDVIAFLSDPATYDPQPDAVTRIDTHGAYVFAAGNEVFKIKRAVRYAYMDFSTLEKRRAACAREVEINAPAAPQIYKGVVAVTRAAGGGLAIGGPGEPVEWAVHMARFREEDVLVNRINRRPLSVDEAKSLADAVAASHARAAVVTTPPDAASIGSIARNVLSDLLSLFGARDATLAALAEGLTRQADAIRDLLQRRARAGNVRRCHGDMHLGNIVFIDGTPTLFDAIEFDETLATTDVLYDLAFLLMDLDHREQRPAANAVLNRYVWRRQEFGDLESLAALPVFLALRAAIRAMVGAQRAQITGQDRQPARAYLERARRYLDQVPPALVLVGGLSGSGKSTLAAALAPDVGRAPGALHLRSDLERKAMLGAGELERLPQAAYSEDATARVYRRILEKAEAALRAGHSVIVDAVHAHPEERQSIAAVAGKTGAKLCAVWLDAPASVLMARVAARKNDASDATPQVVERQLAYDTGVLEWTLIDASGTLEETLRTALSHLHASIGPQ
ncbi:MAG: AAA family ATPase [Hyphomicrobium sp.]|nr:AAA family ATPase [Hyphomicrobium sp.]